MFTFGKIPSLYYTDKKGNRKKDRGYYYMYVGYNTRKERRYYKFEFLRTNHLNHWYILPAIICYHYPTLMPSPSFVLDFKWLNLNLLTFTTTADPFYVDD